MLIRNKFDSLIFDLWSRVPIQTPWGNYPLSGRSDNEIGFLIRAYIRDSWYTKSITFDMFYKMLSLLKSQFTDGSPSSKSVPAVNNQLPSGGELFYCFSFEAIDFGCPNYSVYLYSFQTQHQRLLPSPLLLLQVRLHRRHPFRLNGEAESIAWNWPFSSIPMATNGYWRLPSTNSDDLQRRNLRGHRHNFLNLSPISPRILLSQ